MVISNLATPVTNMQVRSAPLKVWPCLSVQDLSAALSDTERAPSSLKSFVSPSLCCGLMVMQEGAGHGCATTGMVKRKQDGYMCSGVKQPGIRCKNMGKLEIKCQQILGACSDMC